MGEHQSHTSITAVACVQYMDGLHTVCSVCAVNVIGKWEGAYLNECNSVYTSSKSFKFEFNPPNTHHISIFSKAHCASKARWI